jgi:hypothetical protein
MEDFGRLMVIHTSETGAGNKDKLCKNESQNNLRE